MYTVIARTIIEGVIVIQIEGICFQFYVNLLIRPFATLFRFRRVGNLHFTPPTTKKLRYPAENGQITKQWKKRHEKTKHHAHLTRNETHNIV